MGKLKDRVVVVTGASSGIGRATALAFADEGAAVVALARREGAVDDVAAACRERGAEALGLAVDVTDDEAVAAAAGEVVGRLGRLDVWVNNAAVNLFAPVEEAPPDAWRRVVETNLFGAYHGVRAALPWMREQGDGVIVNVSSVLGKAGSPYQSAYVASKHAVRALSDCLRQELEDLPDVDVCTVLPGPIDTPLFRHAANYSGRQVKPIKPVIDADRVAAAVVTCARRPRREVVVGASSRQLLGLARLAPGLLERAVARQVDKDHFMDRPASPSRGNLHAPMAGTDTVSGGWSRSGQQVGELSPEAASNDGHGGRAGKVALAGAALATGLALQRRRR
jgi:NAD(P)-dependent dehydrogenase (short-subunit alcohol dehydrogenase family)